MLCYAMLLLCYAMLCYILSLPPPSPPLLRPALNSQQQRQQGAAGTEGKDVAAMDVYTTTIDKSKLSKEEIERADRLAREIEGEKKTKNRKQQKKKKNKKKKGGKKGKNQEESEEDLHSAVKRTDSAVAAAAKDSFTDAGVVKKAVQGREE